MDRRVRPPATGPAGVVRSEDPAPPARERAFGAAAVRTSLVVGTALTLINHPEVLALEFGRDLVLPVLLNYVVPLLVAGYSRYRLLERLRRTGGVS